VNVGGLKLYLSDLIIVVSLMRVIARFHTGSKEKWNSIIKILWIYIIYGVFTSILSFSSFGLSAFGETARYSYYIVFIGLFVYLIINDIYEFRYLLMGLSIPGILAALTALIDFTIFSLIGVTIFTPINTEWMRFSNALSSLFILFSLVLSLHSIILLKERSLKNYLIATVLFLALVIGQARTVWVAAFIAIPFFYIVNTKSIWILLKKLGKVLLFLVIFLPLLYPIMVSILGEGVERSLNFLSGLENDPDWVWRLLIWEQVFEQASQHWLFGVGMGAKYDYTPPGGIWDEEFLPPPHNGWLSLLYQQGIVGALLVLIIFLLTFFILFKIIKSNRENIQIRFIASTLLLFNFIQFVYFIPFGATLFTFIVPGLTAKLYFFFPALQNRKPSIKGRENQ
jgi:O-antigen ligase